ncbi:MAG: helix-turn-helix domain-containing protein [Planctomycetota bacterium]
MAESTEPETFGAHWDEVLDPSPTDAMEAQRWRPYQLGRVYAVFVPSPFARVNPDASPVLRHRVCSDPGDLQEGGSREPVFVTPAEFAATCSANSSSGAALARLEELERKVAQLGGVPECYSVKQAAQFLGLSDKTVYKLIRDGELRAFQVGGQHRIPSDALEALQQRRSAPPTEAEGAPTKAKPAPLFNPNFRRDSAAD